MQYRKAFVEVPVVGFNKGKSLKDLLARAKAPGEKQTDLVVVRESVEIFALF